MNAVSEVTGRRARSSTSSEQKPGPHRQQQRRGCPGAGGRSRRVSARTCSTEAEDRLPIRASESQVSATAVAATLERLLRSPRAPSGRRGGRPTSRCRRGSARGRRGSRRRRRRGSAPTSAGTSASSTIRSPVRADVPAHRPLGVGVEPAAGGEHLRPAPARDAAGRADRDHGGRAVAEQPAGHQVGHRDVVALHGQRAQLDRHQHRDVVGVADQVVVQPGDARRRRPRSRGRPAAPASRPAAARAAAAIRASREGTASPVTVVETIRSTSVGVRSGGLERVRQRPRAELDGVLDEQVVGAGRSRRARRTRSSGSTRCRCSTPALAWNRRSSRSSRPPPRRSRRRRRR